MDVRGKIATLLDAVARGAAAGADAAAVHGAHKAAKRLAKLALDRHAECGAVVAEGRVIPALAEMICGRAADGAVVEQAMHAASCLLMFCPDEARREQGDDLVRLGALDAAVERMSAADRGDSLAGSLVGSLAEGRCDAVARAVAAAGALPRLVGLLVGTDEPIAKDAATRLAFLFDCGGPPTVAAAADAGAVRAVGELLRQPAGAVSESLLTRALQLLARLVQTPAGAERLVADGALPRVVALLRSPTERAYSIFSLAAATKSDGWGAVADALLADAAAGPALFAVLRGPDEDARFRAACVLGKTLGWALALGGPEAKGRAADLAAAARRAGAVPRLVELLRTTPFEGEQRRDFPGYAIGALAHVCRADGDAAREALAAGAWPVACRAVLKQATGDEGLWALGLSLLADLARHLRGGAPRPAAAAAPGLAAALARALGRAAADRAPLGSGSPMGDGAQVAGDAAAVLEEVFEGSDGAQRAAEFVDAGGAGHLVRAGPALGPPGLWGRAPGLCTGCRIQT
jgi:hypothetical protein